MADRVRPGTPAGRGALTDSGARMLAVAAAGLRDGKPLREIAIDLFGASRVDAEWHADSRMRAQVRRLVQRARNAAVTASGQQDP